MKILGISSATKIISVGLIEGEKILFELSFSGKQAEDLIVYIKKILGGIKPDGIAVAAGPGSYSGLRGGLATAKTLAQVYKIKVVGVSTLETIAYNMIDCEGAVAAVTHARANEYNFALFGIHGGQIARLTDDIVLTFEKLAGKLAKIEGVLTVCGETGNFSNIRAAKNNLPRGSAAAFIGAPLFKTAKKDAYLKLAPNYSHSPNIREFKS